MMGEPTKADRDLALALHVAWNAGPRRVPSVDKLAELSAKAHAEERKAVQRLMGAAAHCRQTTVELGDALDDLSYVKALMGEDA